MKNGRRTIVIFAVIFVVLAVIALLPTQPAAAPESPYAANRVFVNIGEELIQAIRLRNPSGVETFTLNRALDGTWTVPDSTGTLNVYVAELIARTMVLLPYSNTIQPESDLSVYGFVPTAGLGVEFVLNDGTTHAVVVGFRNPTETGYYAVVDNRQEIYILERAAVDFLISVLRNPPVA